MPGHRYINLDVGYNPRTTTGTGTGPGRKGGETKHASPTDARAWAEKVRAVLEGRQDAKSLQEYVLVGVDPSPERGGKTK